MLGGLEDNIMEYDDVTRLQTIMKLYGGTLENTIHDLHKKVWDNAPNVDSTRWAVDMDFMDEMDSKYANEEPLSEWFDVWNQRSSVDETEHYRCEG